MAKRLSAKQRELLDAVKAVQSMDELTRVIPTEPLERFKELDRAVWAKTETLLALTD